MNKTAFILSVFLIFIIFLVSFQQKKREGFVPLINQHFRPIIRHVRKYTDNKLDRLFLHTNNYLKKIKII